MTITRSQNNRSSVVGNRPAVGSRQPGEIYVNWPELQLGTINAAQAPLDLLAVRFFSSVSTYAVGDMVRQAGQLYVANGAIAAGAFNATQWTKVTLAGDPFTGGTIDNAVIGATTPAAASVTSLNGGQLAGQRNRLINGDFRIDQRYSGAGVSIASASTYFCDRWAIGASQIGHTTAYGMLNVAAIGYYGQVNLSSAFTAPGASDYLQVLQSIEGMNIADLLWGTANAKPVTFSGFIFCPVTGNLALSMNNATGTLSYVTTINIPTPNVWTYFQVTIPGPTSGSWPQDNTAGTTVHICLGSGATFQAPSANAWLSGNFLTVAGTINLMPSSGVNFSFKDIQLEPGTVATPFERRNIGTELALCQRYYWQDTLNNLSYNNSGAANITSFYVKFPVQMRGGVTVTYTTPPTVGLFTVSWMTGWQNVANGTWTGTGLTTFSSEL